MLPEQWKSKTAFLVLTSIVMALTMSGWVALLNNFVVEKASFTGAEIGMLQSLREVPGFLAFTAVFLLLAMTEQTLALVSLAVLSLGVAITGYFPFEYGLYATTVLMSIGFHYFETVNNSLALQWLDKKTAPSVLGKLLAVKSFSSLVAYAVIWLSFTWLGLTFQSVYLLIGGAGFVIFVWLWLSFPRFKPEVEQRKGLVLRKRYWLYYALTFFSGARRQIFMVFAGFLMVEKFHYDAADIAALYIANHVLNLYLAPKVGHWIGKIGERKALSIEYIGLIVVFVSYALVEDAYWAAALYVIDHIFFAMAIAIKTYFQKIADPEDIAGSSGVSFTINHIAAVIIPASFGVLWLYQPAWVFYAGAVMAFCSLLLSQGVDVARHSLQVSEKSI